MKTIIEQNGCDLVALTYNDEIIDYTDKDNEIKEWIAQGKGYDWLCVELE